MQNICDIVAATAWNNTLESRGFRLWSPSVDSLFESRGIPHVAVIGEFSSAFEAGLCRSRASQSACGRAGDILDTGWREEASIAFLAAGLVTWCGWFFRGEAGCEAYAEQCMHMLAVHRHLVPDDLMTAYAVLALNCPYAHTSIGGKATALATIFLSVKNLHQVGGASGPDVF